MELGVFVVAFVLVVGIGLVAFGRMPFPTRGRRTADDRSDPRTAEPPGAADDSG
ncbi:MAG: hypothetical protein QOF49_590 [Chloroflexota bacterium]|jgi:hypothetical protein|nr:hypothetical protein [Chloroflexota bacterium]